jgi:hypothetical protein
VLDKAGDKIIDAAPGVGKAVDKAGDKIKDLKEKTVEGAKNLGEKIKDKASDVLNKDRTRTRTRTKTPLLPRADRLLGRNARTSARELATAEAGTGHCRARAGQTELELSKMILGARRDSSLEPNLAHTKSPAPGLVLDLVGKILEPVLRMNPEID